jgi:hypothetical protein
MILPSLEEYEEKRAGNIIPLSADANRSVETTAAAMGPSQVRATACHENFVV